MNALADTDIYPSEAKAALAASAAGDKTLVHVEGADHYLRPVGAQAGDPRARAANDYLIPWLRERWPA
jgi:hypothetical protein